MADENFVLSKIFRFYEIKYPGNRPWSSHLPAEYFFPPNYKEIFSMLRGAMYLGAGELVTEFSKALEINEVKLHGSVDSVRGLVRDRVRVSLHKQQCAMWCFICSRTFHQHPPARDVITKMPCCLGDVHPTCLSQATTAIGYRCPHCQVPITSTGVNTDLTKAVDYLMMRRARDHVAMLQAPCPCAAAINWDRIRGGQAIGECPLHSPEPWRQVPLEIAALARRTYQSQKL